MGAIGKEGWCACSGADSKTSHPAKWKEKKKLLYNNKNNMPERYMKIKHRCFFFLLTLVPASKISGGKNNNK